MNLDPEASAAGVRLVGYEVLGSTNTEALHRARLGERGPLWISARRQTAGRGRRGRTWESPPGNFYASLLLNAPAPVARWPELSFVAVLAVHDAIVELATALEPFLTVKWPNDLLLDGAKLAGILVEGEPAEDGVVAIGIGVNCVDHPTDAAHPATDLASAGETVSAESLLAVLSVRMLRRLAQWNAGAGFPEIRREWLARAVGRGENMLVRLGDRDVTGRFEALDDRGGLVLRLPDGSSMTIAAGDILWPVPAGARCR